MTFVISLCVGACFHAFGACTRCGGGGVAGPLGVSLVSTCSQVARILSLHVQLWSSGRPLFLMAQLQPGVWVMEAERHWVQALPLFLHMSEKEEEEETWAGLAEAGSREALGPQVLSVVVGRVAHLVRPLYRPTVSSRSWAPTTLSPGGF